MKITTRNVTAGNTLEIVSSMNVISCSWQMSSDDGDNGTVQGGGSIRDSEDNVLASQEIPIPAGGGGSQVSPNAAQPIDGLILAAVQGTLYVMMGV